jgi:uncharacterized repeat protein (TIGR03803 family)
MTSLRTCELFPIAAQNRIATSMEKFSQLKIAGFVFLFCAAAAIAAPAQTFTSLVSFDSSNGAEPYFQSLVQGFDGNLYGTTLQGGSIDLGTVFQMTPSGMLTTLYNFCVQNGCTDGVVPYTGLVQATNGNLYGTTSEGGANFIGTVFQITPAGTLTTLHSFDFTDGDQPEAALVQAGNGNFYGTTNQGGANGYGTIFEITAGGTLTTLHNFAGSPSDAANPNSKLIQASNGNFYGTTPSGGTTGQGAVFEMTPNGTVTLLHSFDYDDGANPDGGLVQASNGNFYGTTSAGGTRDDGTVFEITAAGKLTTLYNFCVQAFCPDGVAPLDGLIQATDGNFYGTAAVGGAYNGGTIFRITPAGKLTTLYSFCAAGYPCVDGTLPYGGLFQATNGTFYGTTFNGGADNQGTVFSLSVGLKPFVETLPASGRVGAPVIILGNNLTGTSSLTFNGIGAQFAVVSSSEIKTAVPAGATSGFVEVTTPGGALKSGVPFRVMP